MIKIKDYIRPKTLEEADSALNYSRNAVVIGGGAFLRLGNKNISSAVDLSELGLSAIDDDEGRFYIGAMVSFGDLERSVPLHQAYNGLFRKALKDVVGVQFRNTVTVGGTVFSRYGFSDLIPSLLALDAEVKCLRNGFMKLEKFLDLKISGKDILTHVQLPKNCTAAACHSARLTTGDYPVLNLAIAQVDGIWRIAVGARPGRAASAHRTMEILNNHHWNDQTMIAAAECISAELNYGSNTRGSAEYRRQLAGALLKKAIQEVRTHADSTNR